MGLLLSAAFIALTPNVSIVQTINTPTNFLIEHILSPPKSRFKKGFRIQRNP
jgi:hypothetical protein